MAVSFPDAVSSYVTTASEDVATNDLSHVVTTGTTLLLCFVAHKAIEGVTSVTWNTVSLTKITDLETESLGSDAGGSIWGLISPTPATADFEITGEESIFNGWHIKAGINVHGTNIDSVAAAISNLTLDENNVIATNTNVHASGGTVGNWLLFFGVGIGDDMLPISNNASFNELAEINSGGGSSDATDGSIYLADKTGVSAITVTFSATDENVGGLFEIVVAAAGGATPKGPLGLPLAGAFGGPI